MRTTSTIPSEQVAIYIRWSTDEQTQGTTLEIQRDACRAYAVSQGWTVADERIYIDDGYSGASLDRPAMTRLREAISQQRIRCVIVFAIDRLSRNIVDAVNLVLEEWDQRCDLKCVRQPIDTTTDLGRMIFGILAMFADFERGQIRARTVAGRVRRAAERVITELPYGYRRLEDHSVIIDEAEAAIVRLVYDMCLRGHGVKQILAHLHQVGSRTREGAEWGRSTASRMLHNQAYTGTWTYGRRRVGRKGEAGRVRRDEPLVVSEQRIPEIIPPAMWEAVQVLMSQRDLRSREGGRALGSPYLLTGLARCRCGGRFIAREDRIGTGYYQCARRRDLGPAACDCRRIPQAAAHQMVIAQLTDLRTAEVRRKLRESQGRQIEQQVGSLRVRIAEAEAAIRRLDAEMARYDRDYRAGSLPAARYDRLLSGVETERVAHMAQVQQLQTELAGWEAQRTTGTQLEASIARLDQWDGLETMEQKELLRQLVNTLMMYRAPESDTVEIELEIRGIVQAE